MYQGGDHQMTTNKQLEANRQNALQSTGPQTREGAEICKKNAFRHGLRAVETVVPGENPIEWETHRTAVVADIAPAGALETALAEQVAAKFWRLGRVLRYEADLIANAQDPAELAHSHDKAHNRLGYSRDPNWTEFPTREDVAGAKRKMDEATKKLTNWADALSQLQTLATMNVEDAFPNWNLYEILADDFRLDEDDLLEHLFKGEGESPFLARHAWMMLANTVGTNSDMDGLQEALVVAWARRLEQLEKDANSLQVKYKRLARRYKEAIERRRRASGLPESDDLDRIQRYEAHLERGLHKALDRLRDLREARGAVPPRSPSVAVAVVQAGPETGRAGEIGPFGSFVPEALKQ